MNDSKSLIYIVSKNLAYYRKEAGLTQAEVALKVQYSDKSISKWERGEGIPDVETLKNLADFYQITVDDLLSNKKRVPKKEYKKRHIVITLLSVGLVWLVVTVGFVLSIMIAGGNAGWMSLFFVYGLPASSIILTVFSCLWAKKIYKAISVSAIVWTTCFALFITLSMFITETGVPFWTVFLIGIPLQLLIVLWQLLKVRITFKAK